MNRLSLPSLEELLAVYSAEERQAMLRETKEWRQSYHAESMAQRQAGKVRDYTDYELARDSQELMELVLRDFHHRLHAHACLLFVADDSTDCYLLQDSFCVVQRIEFAQVALPLLPANTAHVDHVLLGSSELEHEATLNYLFKPDWYEWMDVRLTGIKEPRADILRVIRSRQQELPFDGRDWQLADVLVEKYALAANRLEQLPDDSGRLSEILLDLNRQLREVKSEKQICNILLEKCGQLVRANRGELALWDDRSKDLTIRAQFGPTVDPSIRVGEPVRSPSIIRKVWSNGRDLYLPRVMAGIDEYYQADENTRSEFALRFDWIDSAVGVINVESYREDGFSQRDLEWLRLLSQLAAGAIARCRGEAIIRPRKRLIRRFAAGAIATLRKDPQQLGLLNQLTDGTMPDLRVLKLTLQSVQAYLGYDAALVYCADFARRELICVESIGCDKQLEKLENHRITDFKFAFDETSLACKVFLDERPYYVEDLKTDKDVSQKGVEIFDIHGPLVGVPLFYKDEAVGVLVVWSRQGTRPHEGTPCELEPFVQFAAPSIAVKADSEFHQAMLDAANHILEIRGRSNSDVEILEQATKFLGKVFDRVRLFKFDANEMAFIGLDSEGMEKQDEFRNVKIHLATNPYAQDTAETAVTNPHARKYPMNQLGVDPDADRLQKDAALPWVVAPLVVNQRLYGQIVVDNAKSKREFKPRDFEYLNLLATLLAETLANVESVEAMRQKALPILLRRLGIQDSLDAYIRYFLVFMTSGHGLGFSRGVFLQFEAARRRLVFYDGIGSVTARDFDTIAKSCGHMELEEQMQLALKISDDLKLNDFSFQLTDEECGLFEQGLTDGPQVVPVRFESEGPFAAVVRRVSECISGSDFLIGRLHKSSALSGLFVVDRSWQQRTLTRSDQAQLEGFLELAEFLLADYAKMRRFMQRLDDVALIGHLARALNRSYDAQTVKNALHKLDRLRSEVRNGETIAARETLDSLEKQLEHALRSVERLEGLLQPHEKLKLVHPRNLLHEVVEVIKEDITHNNVQINIRVGSNVPGIWTYREDLWRAVYVVVMNSIEAFIRADSPERRIDLVANACPDDYLEIEILDTGPGVPDDALKARQFIDAFTSDANKGLGLGLLNVENIVEQIHHGVFKISNREDRQGVRVLMRLPAADSETVAATPLPAKRRNVN